MNLSRRHSSLERSRRSDRARPFVLVNMAMTADGKIATANRRISSFGSPRDQEHLYELRATVDAVMAGARTLDLNAIHLGPGGARFRRQRLRRGLAEYNLRIVVSGSGSINPEAAIFRRHFAPLLLLTTETARQSALRRLQGRVDAVLVCGEREVDFRRALGELRRRWNVRRLLCEGGGELNAALFRARLVDELHLTVCPKVFGGRSAPTIADGPDPLRLPEATAWSLHSARRVADEMFLVFHPRASPGAGGHAQSR